MSYVATIVIGFDSDPGNATVFYLWPVLVGGSLDPYVTVKIATTLATTYVRATVLRMIMEIAYHQSMVYRPRIF